MTTLTLAITCAFALAVIIGALILKRIDDRNQKRIAAEITVARRLNAIRRGK